MNLLIIDDDENVRSSMIRFLGLQGHHTQGVASAREAQSLITEKTFDALLLDLRMPEMDGLEFLSWMSQEGFTIPTVMISAHGEVRDAVGAMKLGARDYLTKPVNPEELLLRLDRLDKELHLQKDLNSLHSAEGKGSESSACFWGQTPRMLTLRTELSRAAATDATVLLSGNSGTGKEVTARWIHSTSPRRGEAFLTVNLGSLSESLIESELFGYEKGAFTGAAERRQGIFEAAQGGTVFLDEIGELPLALQPRLLRVLQEGMVRRVGNPREFPIDIRVIGATNRRLDQMVKAGTFREDLFYRLNVLPFILPNLEDRIADLPELVGVLLEKIGRRIGKRNLQLHPDGLPILRSYSFPGNIRELENLLERWAILESGNQIKTPAILGDLRDSPPVSPGTPTLGSDPAPGSMSLRDWEQEAIRRALVAHQGNRTKAAGVLGISRKTLIQKIAVYFPYGTL